MRTPNTECCVCSKPLYRRPFELKRVRYVACMEHRHEAQKAAGVTDSQRAALSLGRTPGTNHRTGYKHKESSKRKASKSRRAWNAANRDKIKARGAKTRGVNHYNWKGGVTRLNTAVRRMTEYRRWAESVVQRDGKCTKCGSETGLESHHVKPLAEIMLEHGITTTNLARGCSELWDVSNGQTLCERCHCAEHGRTYTQRGNGRRKKVRQ
jgi:5-methylcytosine-specific restriction endonuclease McrA